MKPFDPTLKRQHDSILGSLKGLETSWKGRTKKEIQKELRNLYEQILQHHYSEWELLFSQNISNSHLNQGGPFCTYFFDSFMQNRPQDKVLQLLKTSKNSKFISRGFQIPGSLQEVFQARSMLTVPLEEQLALLILLEVMNEALVDWEALDQRWFDQCLEFTVDLAKRNIEKEETCLWVLIHQACAQTKS